VTLRVVEERHGMWVVEVGMVEQGGGVACHIGRRQGHCLHGTADLVCATGVCVKDVWMYISHAVIH
jgi:hypothetical protein